MEIIYRCPDEAGVTVPNGVLLPEFALENASRWADRRAFVDGVTGRTLTFAQVDELVYNIAAGITDLGIRPGESVLLLLPNMPEYAVLFLGIIAAGAVVTTANPAYSARELAHQMVDAGARMVITSPELLEKVHHVKTGQSIVFVVINNDSSSSSSNPPGTMSIDRLLRGNGSKIRSQRQHLHTTHQQQQHHPSVTAPKAPPTAAVVPSQHDTCALPYSSGTTGVSKGVMLSHRNLIANVQQLLAGTNPRLDLCGEDVVLGLLPMFHIYAITLVNLLSLRGGACVVTLPRFDLHQYLRTLQEYKISVAPIVPPIILAMAKLPLVDSFDLSSLRRVVSGAAPLGAELETAFRAKFPTVQLGQGYGMTEASPTVTASRLFARVPHPPAPGSCGSVLPLTEVKVVHTGTGSRCRRMREGSSGCEGHRSTPRHPEIQGSVVRTRGVWVGAAAGGGEGATREVVDTSTGESMPPNERESSGCEGHSPLFNQWPFQRSPSPPPPPPPHPSPPYLYIPPNQNFPHIPHALHSACFSPQGYLNNPEATAATITPDGWLRTGDVAYVDKMGEIFVVDRVKELIKVKGFQVGCDCSEWRCRKCVSNGDVAYVDWAGEIFVVDRVKELIKVKGFQVPPAELEGLLIAHPDIADAAVVPAPSEESGEVPVAFVVLSQGGAKLSVKEVKDFISKQLFARLVSAFRPTFLPCFSVLALSVPSVVEKGFRDDMLPWSNGGQVHVKSNFMLSDEERAKIAAMRARSMSKRKDGSSSGTVTPIASGTVTPHTVSAVLASPVASTAPAASKASTATETAAASTTEVTAATTTTTTTTTTVTTSTTATTETAAAATVTASTATSTVSAAAQKESVAVTTALAGSAAAGAPVDMSNVMLVFDGSDDESGYTESSLEESVSAQVAPAAPVAAAVVPAAASPVVSTGVPDSVPEVVAASVSQAAQVVQVQGPDSIATATVEVVKEVQKEVQATSAQQMASATTTKTDVTIIKTATQVASEATTMTSAKVASVSTSTKAAASAAAASAGASVQATMSSTTGRASEQSTVRGGGGGAADLNGRVGSSSRQPAMADSEAAESSWESGDEVESMEGSSVSGMTDRQVVKRGRGLSGKGRNRNGGLLGQVLRVGDGLTPVMKQVLGTGAFMLAMVALWPRPQKQSRVQLE
ncbi:unnamed protein product [Closterium sp. NIES-64]|nr:unnamed protein product [Closterium sp. NIES-64]